MIDVEPMKIEEHYRVIDSAGAVVHEGMCHVGALGLITYDDPVFLSSALPVGTYTIEPGAIELTVLAAPPLDTE